MQLLAYYSALLPACLYACACVKTCSKDLYKCLPWKYPMLARGQALPIFGPDRWFMCMVGELMPQWVVGYHEADSLNEVEEKLSEVFLVLVLFFALHSLPPFPGPSIS